MLVSENGVTDLRRAVVARAGVSARQRSARGLRRAHPSHRRRSTRRLHSTSRLAPVPGRERPAVLDQLRDPQSRLAHDRHGIVHAAAVPINRAAL